MWCWLVDCGVIHVFWINSILFFVWSCCTAHKKRFVWTMWLYGQLIYLFEPNTTDLWLFYRLEFTSTLQQLSYCIIFWSLFSIFSTDYCCPLKCGIALEHTAENQQFNKYAFTSTLYVNSSVHKANSRTRVNLLTISQCWGLQCIRRGS